jgi:hypothetical protein
MSLYIVTLAEMKQDLGITDTQDDAALTLWLEGLQGRFDDYLSRVLLRSDRVEIHDGGESFLYLKAFPVESIATVHIDYDQEWPADSLLPASEYRLRGDRGLVTFGSYGPLMAWPEGFQNIRVAYTGGFVATGDTPASGQTAMPAAIRRCFFMQAGFEWRNRTNLGKESVSAQGASVALAPAQLLPEVKDGLQPYRRII